MPQTSGSGLATCRYGETMRARVPLLATFLAATGCPHITHPARVTPGFSADALVAPAIEKYEEPSRPAPRDSAGSGSQYDVQLDLRYGWARRDGLGIQIEAMLPHALAVYTQLHAEPDLGAGLLVGPNPGVYAMVGNAWLADGRGCDLNAGVRLHALMVDGRNDGPIANGALFATAAYSSGAIRAGLFAEHHEFARPTSACDENCTLEDHVRRRSSAGIFVSRVWQ